MITGYDNWKLSTPPEGHSPSGHYCTICEELVDECEELECNDSGDDIKWYHTACEEDLRSKFSLTNMEQSIRI